MLWTIMPDEYLYNDVRYTQNSPVQHLVCYNGVAAVTEEVDAESLRIVKLLSTEPNDYLDSNLIPGTIIKRYSLCEQDIL